MSFRSFFQPTMGKVVLALITSLAYTILRTAIPLIISNDWNIIGYFSIAAWVTNVILLGIFVYPFACSLASVYYSRKHLRGIEDKILVIVGFLIFNPVVIEAILLYLLVIIFLHRI